MKPLDATISVLRDIVKALREDDLEPSNVEMLLDEVDLLLQGHDSVRVIWGKMTAEELEFA